MPHDSVVKKFQALLSKSYMYASFNELLKSEHIAILRVDRYRAASPSQWAAIDV
jgi:hypothetical protein